jgi:hypothetical protein
MGMCEGSQAFGCLSKALKAGEFRQTGIRSLCVGHGLVLVGMTVRRGPSLATLIISEYFDTSIRFFCFCGTAEIVAAFDPFLPKRRCR